MEKLRRSPFRHFLIVRVELLFHHLRAQRLIDPPLDRRPLVVRAIDAPRQLDEARAEIAAGLAISNRVLDLPGLPVGARGRNGLPGGPALGPPLPSQRGTVPQLGD